MSNNYYTFPALRGKQGEYDFYLLLCPLDLLPRIFLFDEVQVPLGWQPRAPLNPAVVGSLVDYLRTNPEDYVFAPLVATASTSFEFIPAGDDSGEIGLVKIPMQTILVIQDGQHRRAAIKQRSVTTPAFMSDTVPVMLFADPTLDRSPAIFNALNQQYVRGNASRRVAHDSTGPLAKVARRVAQEAPIFQGRVEYEKTTISNRSIALFTINAIFQATQALLNTSEQREVSEAQSELALLFWTRLGDIIPEWQQLIAGKTSPAGLRPRYVHVHSVTLLAIGRAGAALISATPETWQAELDAWRSLDWSRQNSAWEGRAMLQGRMSKKHSSIQLTANLLKLTLGLPLTEKEKVLEKLLEN